MWPLSTKAAQSWIAQNLPLGGGGHRPGGLFAGMLDVECKEWGVGNTIIIKPTKPPSACFAPFFRHLPPTPHPRPPAFIRFPGRGGILPPRSGVHAVRHPEIPLPLISPPHATSYMPQASPVTMNYAPRTTYRLGGHTGPPLRRTTYYELRPNYQDQGSTLSAKPRSSRL